MDDLIRRQAAIDAECEVCQIAPKRERGHNCTYYVHGCKEIECLRALPSAQPRNGEWIDYSDEGYVECPFCHSATNCEGDKDELHYCFSCGAELR